MRRLPLALRLAVGLFALGLAAAGLLAAAPAEQFEGPWLEHPREVQRGDFLPVTILLRSPVEQVRGALFSPSGGRLLEVPAFPLGGAGSPQAWMLLMGLPSWLEGGAYRLEVYGLDLPEPEPAAGEPPAGGADRVGHLDVPDGSRTLLYRGGVSVLARPFPVERVALDSRLTQLRAEETPRKTEQTRTLTEILYTVDPRAVYHPGRLALPLPDGTRRTGVYADRRVYEYADGNTSSTVHNGIDFAVPVGTPVQASGSGLVVLARERDLTGKSVVIEHLPGLYTLYYHLSSLEVEEGALVQAGQLIGRSGKTGLATGPHLHWEVRVGGVAVDPEALTRQRIIDKKAIFGMMKQVLGP